MTRSRFVVEAETNASRAERGEERICELLLLSLALLLPTSVEDESSCCQSRTVTGESRRDEAEEMTDSPLVMEVVECDLCVRGGRACAPPLSFFLPFALSPCPSTSLLPRPFFYMFFPSCYKHNLFCSVCTLHT